MDIAAMSVILSQSKVQQQAGLSVMKMAMGVAKNTGDSITALIGQSTQPNLGTSVDIQA